MADFTYEALARTGQKSIGTLTANSEREAALILDGRGLFPIRIGLARTQAGSGGGFSFGRRVKARHLATMYSQLADLLRSGVPLLRSLELLERQLQRRPESLDDHGRCRYARRRRIRRVARTYHGDPAIGY